MKSNVKVVHDPYTCAREGNIRALKRLIDEGLDVNATSWSGWTLLHRAAENGHTEVCLYLLQRGAKPDVQTTWGWHTAVHLALGNGWRETAEFLVEAGLSGRRRNKAKLTPAQYAHSKGYTELSNDFKKGLPSIEGRATFHRQQSEAAETAKRQQKRTSDMFGFATQPTADAFGVSDGKETDIQKQIDNRILGK